MNLINLFEEVCNFIVIIRFIRIKNRTIGKLIRLILHSIDITKTTWSQKTLHGLSILRHHQMDLQSIKITALPRLRATKLF